MDYWTGFSFFYFVSAVICISKMPYTIYTEQLAFEEASIYCKKKNGFLTNINVTETSTILQAIKKMKKTTFTSFWIGLKKNDRVCVQDLPLKGFYWTVDNSTKYEINKWKTEPLKTCLTALCGLIVVEYKGSEIISWGLAADRCKQTYPFICKLEGLTEVEQDFKSPCPKLQLTGSHDIMQKNNDPYTVEVTCNSKETFTLTCSVETGEWKVEGATTREPKSLCQDCTKGFKWDANGGCVDINECKESHQCTQCINTLGSYTCKNISADSFVNSAANSTDKPQDITAAPRSTGDLSNILIPAIIAVLIFIVLIIIIAAIVKYCLMRRASKQAKKKAALKAAIALNGSDSLEKVNEENI